MSRIARRFQELRRQGRKALIPYLVGGDPNAAASVAAMHALVAAGADLLELGVPFSDPMAEGTAIQRGHERALAKGGGLLPAIDIVRAFRRRDETTPVVLMGYANPIVWMGLERCSALAHKAGVDGMLTVDVPLEETAPWRRACTAQGLDTILLVAPTTSPKRAQAICELAQGYLYYISLRGTTGGTLRPQSGAQEGAAQLAQLRRCTSLPLCVGFGIRDAATARSVAPLCDGVVVGSAVVESMAKLGDKDNGAEARTPEETVRLLTVLRAALDNLEEHT